MSALWGKIGQIIAEFWDVLAEMSPYLLFGFAVAGALSVLVSGRLIRKHLGGRRFWPVLKAAVFGVPLPLCSCGVIPVAASLRKHGAGRGATTAFLLSTPQTGVDSIMVTFSLLGPLLAVFRPIAALVTGVLGGSLISLFDDDHETTTHAEAPPEAHTHEPVEKGPRLLRALRYGFVTLPRDIGKPLLVGLAIAGVITAVVPENLFAGQLGSGIPAYLVMMALGIPIYVCATASVPVAAALIFKGVSPGAAMIFLMTGPATNAATISIIWRTMGRRTALLYLLTTAVSALGAGVILDAFFRVQVAAEMTDVHQLLPPWVKLACAIVLLALLSYALVGPMLRRRKRTEAAPAGKSCELAVSGMTCSHCVERVRQAVSACPGVEQVEVTLKPPRARLLGTDFNIHEVKRAVEEAGYEVKEED